MVIKSKATTKYWSWIILASVFIISFIFVLIFHFMHQNKLYENHQDFFEEFSKHSFKTDRLFVHLTEEKDIDILSKYLLDKNVTSQIDPMLKEGFSDNNAANQFLWDTINETNHYSFTISLKETEKQIGQICYIYSDNLLMVSYWIASEYQGHGYASEISLPLTKKIFESCDDIKTLYIACDYENNASAKLAEKIFKYINQDSNYTYKYNENTYSGFHYKEFVLLKNKPDKNK